MKSILSILLSAALAVPLAAQTSEDFETYPVPAAGFAQLTVSLVDSNTVEPGGIGPNLVQPGCAYSTNGPFLQWNAPGYFGQLSKNLCGAGTELVMEYVTPPTNLSFTLQVFNNAPDLVTVELWDASRRLVETRTGISVVDGTPVPFEYRGHPIATVKIIATQQLSSPIVDNHEWGGPDLRITGSCPGGKVLTITGATPLGSLAIAHGAAGSFTIPSGPCAGTILDITAPTLAGFFNADVNGDFSLNFNVPAGLCGRTVQAVDMTTCLASQPIVL